MAVRTEGGTRERSGDCGGSPVIKACMVCIRVRGSGISLCIWVIASRAVDEMRVMVMMMVVVFLELVEGERTMMVAEVRQMAN